MGDRSAIGSRPFCSHDAPCHAGNPDRTVFLKSADVRDDAFPDPRPSRPVDLLQRRND